MEDCEGECRSKREAARSINVSERADEPLRLPTEVTCRVQCQTTEQGRERGLYTVAVPGPKRKSWLAAVLLVTSLLGFGVRLATSHAAPTSEKSDSSQGHQKHKPKETGQEPAERGVPRRGPGHQRMLQVLQEISVRGGHEHPYMGDGRVQELSRQLADLEAHSSEVTTPAYRGDLNRWQVLLDLGIGELRLGRLEPGIEHLLAAYRLLPKIKPHVQKMLVDKTIFELGVGYMRLGETQNCVLQHNPEMCILPLRGRAIHALREGSTKAIQYFLEVLKSSSPAGAHGYYYPALWLLNIAHMTLDQYPDQVPERYRIPASEFESKVSFTDFQNVAMKLGLDTFNLSGGVIIEDFDGDHDLDIVTSTWDLSGPMHLFINNSDGTFSDRTAEAGLEGLLGGLNLLQADYDNDGSPDIFVLRGAWAGKAGQYPNSLLRNRGDGTFEDVTFAAGLAEANYPTQTAGWADYDNDGDLDLFIGNEADDSIRAPSQLFQNQGDGTFRDVAEEAGVKLYAYTKGVSWGDYDGDGFPDLYVSNFQSMNRRYRNQGDGTFKDVTLQVGVAYPKESFPVWFWDYNNDGSLDLFVSSYAGSIAHQALYRLGRPQLFEKACLYEGDGRGSFREVADQYGLGIPIQPMGSNFGDLNNDGYLDFYLGTGDPSYSSIVPNLMFLNLAGQRFADISVVGGFAHLQKGHGVAFADLDNDGDLDVFEQMGGAFPGDAFSDALYENPGVGNNWLAVQLVGRQSNRSAIGARIRVQIQEDGRTRSIYRHVNSGGSFGANPLRQTFGLGKAKTAELLEIFWPRTGKTQTLRNLPPGQFMQVVEGEEGYTELSLKRFKF